jgi:hypothetical protein
MPSTAHCPRARSPNNNAAALGNLILSAVPVSKTGYQARLTMNTFNRAVERQPSREVSTKSVFVAHFAERALLMPCVKV